MNSASPAPRRRRRPPRRRPMARRCANRARTRVARPASGFGAGKKTRAGTRTSKGANSRAGATRADVTKADATAAPRPQFALCQTGGAERAAHRQPQGSLKLFQAKWVPVRVKKTRQNKELKL